ncbi:hypothetical protein PsorP6_007088 [Peronosclerospora sorghi]|uniref:Uncharacterized protein n=1 Tax=Peronosclerospora sorghi TaxID=230839 RepID=A0ACC0W8D3_9STRA|nr:hypothetical protein PsorP6_007088 [Peronosclerospora sorghi]
MGNGVSSEMEIFAAGEMEAELKRLGGTGDASVKQLVEKGFHDVVQLVIRPKRALYDVHELGPESFKLPPQRVDPTQDEVMEVRRRDFHVVNARDLRIRCSHWQLFARASTLATVTPCLIYLHSNIGSRVDALRVRDAALARGFSVLAFDSCGSGLSDGLYVSMGWNEAVDLVAVLEHVEHDASVSDICFYAHSMGAFPAVSNLAIRAAGAANKAMQAKLQTLPHVVRTKGRHKLLKPIRALVLDSGYASVKEINEGLLRQMQHEGFTVPNALLKVVMAAINKSVKKRTDVELESLRPVDFVPLCYAPALFIAANNDRYVSKEQSAELAAKYAGPFKILHVEGEHYDPRHPATYTQAIDFLYDMIHPKLP